MRNTGKVLRIEKTSIHDGEGLRTVVFLKGCPLRCKWCSTPESQHMQEEVGFGQDMTVDEVVEEICKDEIFFFHSGGGVTISGGEVLAQPEFTKEILKSCMEQGIQTAIETSLYAPYLCIQDMQPYITTMYIDFKMADSARHKLYTGVENHIIKENLTRLDKEYTGDIHIRIPIIPTINMTEENMKETAEFLMTLKNIKDVELLPYHRLGVETYKRLGKEYELEKIKSPDITQMRRMAKVLKNYDPKCKVIIKGEHYTEE